MKECVNCRQMKSLEHFHRKAKARDGRAYRCKECIGVQTQRYYEANAELVKARVKAYAAANTEAVRGRARAAYTNNPSVAKKRARQWAAENPSRRSEIAKASAVKCIDRKRAQNAAYVENLRVNFPEKYKETNRRAASVRRARVTGGGGTISREWWQAIFDVVETGACLYCGKLGQKLTMDHWIAVSKGGATEPGNLIPCCKPCNSSKHNADPIEWLSKQGRTADWYFSFLDATREAFLAEAGAST